MKIVRWAAAAATALMGLMNLPFAFDSGEQDVPLALGVVISLLGVAGLVAAFGLLRRASWGRPAVLVVGVLNVIGAVVALATGTGGAAIGLTVSLLGLVLGFLAADAVAEPATASPV